MDDVEVSTVVYLPAPDIYEFLLEFPRYANYSKHLREVAHEGDGGPGTRYDITFAWWRLSYTAHAEVTGVDPPRRIDWRLTRDLDARGHWKIDPAEAPPDKEAASRVRLHVTFDPASADGSVVDLPSFVSIEWVVEKVKPLIQREAERIVERIVADIEGEPRPVEITVHTGPDSV